MPYGDKAVDLLMPKLEELLGGAGLGKEAVTKLLQEVAAPVKCFPGAALFVDPLIAKVVETVMELIGL